jgi:hypothetical protein
VKRVCNFRISVESWNQIPGEIFDRSALCQNQSALFDKSGARPGA